MNDERVFSKAEGWVGIALCQLHSITRDPARGDRREAGAETRDVRNSS